MIQNNPKINQNNTSAKKFNKLGMWPKTNENFWQDIDKHLSEVKLKSDGQTIYSVEDNEVFDALKNGQLTFFETIDNITKEVKEDVSKFELDKERFLNLLTKVEDDVLSQQLQA